MLLGAPNDAAWARLCDGLEDPALGADARFASIRLRVDNRAVLIPLLERRFRENTVAHWVDRLERKGIAVSPLNTLDQVFAHPQVLANEMLVTLADTDGADMPLVGMPFKMETDDGLVSPSRRPVPRLGAHTDEILKDVLGYSADEAAALCREGAV